MSVRWNPVRSCASRIITWNGAAVDSLSQLRTLIAGLGIGDTVRLVVQRDAGRFEATVTAGGV